MEQGRRKPARAVCIHGHFYQPPRENPWTERIKKQESAHPYHDWNARITEEAYRPNAAARILGPGGEVEELVCNYARISFDFGPTLLRWMEKEAPDVYRTILEADQDSRIRFSGHGSAMAQSYHHSILPLANQRDRLTEVRWGIRDFTFRFGRKPEGMWLPETGVDLETLEILAGEGIRFTILCPSQAWKVRSGPDQPWIDVNGGRIDGRRPYRIELPSGRSIAVFLYQGHLAKEVAFNGMLHNGEVFAHALIRVLDGGPEAQLASIATDGETFGHHHRFGEMALAYALRTIEGTEGIALTIYGEFLKQNPPTWEVRIHENTAWSCVHGLGRWSSDCGCNVLAPAGWNQQWRQPLRRSLNWLRDAVAGPFEEQASQLLVDPWAARDDYVALLLDTRKEAKEAFLNRWMRPRAANSKRALRLLELQRNALKMFTSCGWFFNDVSGIETVQILSYAVRVVELAEQLLGLEVWDAFLDHLDEARSNRPEIGSAKDIVLNQIARPGLLRKHQRAALG